MITIFEDVYHTKTPHYISIDQFVKLIRTGGKHLDTIKSIRALPKDKANELKKSLPQICLGGRFTERSSDHITEHSGYIPLDFDGLSKQDLLKLSPYIYMAWDSTSGTGSRAIVRVPPPTDKLNSTHAKYFASLKGHFNTTFWDDNLKSCVAGAYLSYDPNIYINEDAPVWTELPTPQAPVTTTTLDSNTRFEHAIKWMANQGDHFSPGNRNPYIFKLSSALCRAGLSQSEATDYLLRFEQDDFTAKEIRSAVRSGYKASAKDAGTWDQTISPTPVRVQATPQEVVQHDSFWDIIKDKPVLNRTKYLEFLQGRGIYQYRINKEGATILIIIRDNIVERIDKVDIGVIIKDHLSDEPFYYEAFLRGADSYLSDSLLRFLEVKTIHWNKDKRDTSWLYFSNTAVLCSKDNPKCVPYSDIPNFIWKSQILPREFNYLDNTLDYEDSTFPRFISAITGGDNDKNIALITVIGYLIHAFRDPTKPSAILLTDEILSDNPHGGTGKGIFTKALQYFRIHQDYDGKSFSFDRNFLWQGISFDTQIVVIDDIPKSFPFERLFSVLTNGIQVENKNSKTFYIPFQDSPKFIISANSAIKGEGNSHERRKLEIEFSNFFHRDNTPKDYFGHQLFDDWNSEQWVQFDNFMLTCMQVYFQKGLIYPKSINIELKKLHANTSSEFIEWAEANIFPEMMISKREFYDRFIDACPNQKRFTSSVRFYSFVESYASFYKLNLKSTKLNGVHIFKFDK